MARKAPVRPLNQIKYGTVHHSGTNPGAPGLSILKTRARQYDRLHGQASYALETKGEYGYKYISYHYLVARDGSILQVQDPKYVRHHASDNFRGPKSHNLYGIAVMLDGNFEIEQPTPAQLRSAAKIFSDFNRKYQASLEIKGHREQAISSAPTACPGKNMGLSTNPTSKLSWIIRNTRGGSLISLKDLIIRLLQWLFGGNR